jgi:hypothetical protein
MRSVFEHETAVAIGAFDEILVAHLQEYARMAERAAAAVAADAGVFHGDDLRRFDGHGEALWAWAWG